MADKTANDPILRNLGRAEDRPVVLTCEEIRSDGVVLPNGIRVDHDYRPETQPPSYLGAEPRTYLVCVWCRAVACGSASSVDPCIEPWHHEPRPHRTKAGATWPIGGSR